jgi:hypothetical protein
MVSALIADKKDSISQVKYAMATFMSKGFSAS